MSDPPRDVPLLKVRSRFGSPAGNWPSIRSSFEDCMNLLRSPGRPTPYADTLFGLSGAHSVPAGSALDFDGRNPPLLLTELTEKENAALKGAADAKDSDRL